jgi:serine/threonine protein kinase
MISDFGAANLAKELTQTSENVNFSPTYRPPEHDDADFFVDSFWDVWSLGCLFLEFATWILMGQVGVEEFSNKRIGPDSAWCPGIPTDSFFWQCEKKVGDEIQRDVEVRPAVSEVSWATLSHRPLQSLYTLVSPKLVNLPSIRESRMLIPPFSFQWIDRLHRHEKCTELLHEFLNIITYDMLVVNSSERKAAGTIYKALSKRRRERREDCDWCMKPCPWIHPRSPPCQIQSPEEYH